MPLVVGENSYVDLEYAINYFSERLNSDAWDNSTSDNRVKALITATKKIDRQHMLGRKAVNSQKLEFPRALYSYQKDNFFNSYFITENGNKYNYNTPGWIREDEVSDRVKNAVCEEALALLKGFPKRLELQQQGVKSMSVGDLSEAYSGSLRKIISQEALELLAPYLGGSYEIC